MNSLQIPGFELDARLVADTAFVADWQLCQVRLMDDARFPWLVLVPRRPGLVELDELTEAESSLLMREIERAMQALRTAVDADKLNVGALGNIVRQLHVHVVARRRDDVAWPGPVWDSGMPRRYTPKARAALLARLHPNDD